MDTAIIVSIISGAFTLIGTIVSVVVGFRASAKNAEQSAAVHQAITDTKIEELTREVRKHNNFAERMPVIEEKIKVINHRLDDLEGGTK